MKHIKISFLENGVEKDFVKREIPSFNEYNFPKGLIVDLHLLLMRNSLETMWMREQIKNLKILED